MRRLLTADLRQVREHFLALVSAFVLFVFSLSVDLNNFDEESTRALLVGSLSISIAIAARFSFERTSAYAGSFLVGIGLLAIFFTAHKDSVYFAERFWQLAIATHLWIAISPAIRTRFRDEFLTGRLNWFLLTRMAIVGVQSAILLIGLLVAIQSLNFLFGLEVGRFWFQTVWCFVLYLVTTFLLVSALGERETEANPEILRRLVQSVFVPLTVLYFIILYLYAGQILFTRSWPKGMVGLPVAGLSLMVTFTFLISRPFEKKVQNSAWIEKTKRWSFALLLPLLFLLVGAIWRRVSDYGWTEDRIVLALLTGWMIAISISYFNPRKRTLHAIPVSLLILVISVWVGPLSLQSMALRSQTSQFQRVFGKPNAGERTLDIMEYICRNHGRLRMTHAFQLEEGWDARANEKSCYRYSEESLVVAAAAKLGLTIPSHRGVNDEKLAVSFDYPQGESETIEVNGAFVLVQRNNPPWADELSASEGLSFALSSRDKEPVLRWRFKDGPVHEFDLMKAGEKLNSAGADLRTRTFTQSTEEGTLSLQFFRLIITEARLSTDLGFIAVYTPKR